MMRARATLKQYASPGIDVPRELRFAHDGHEDKIRNNGLDLDPFKDEPT